MDAFNKAQVRKVKIQDYDILDTVGMGTFSRVRLVKHKTSGKFFVAKILKKVDIVNNKQVDHIVNEVKILSYIKSNFIVRKNKLKNFKYNTIFNKIGINGWSRTR